MSNTLVGHACAQLESVQYRMLMPAQPVGQAKPAASQAHLLLPVPHAANSSPHGRAHAYGGIPVRSALRRCLLRLTSVKMHSPYRNEASGPNSSAGGGNEDGAVRIGIISRVCMAQDALLPVELHGYVSEASARRAQRKILCCQCPSSAPPVPLHSCVR